MEPQASSVPLEKVLADAERASTLAQMRAVMGIPSTDSMLAAIAQRDPSLLLEDSARRTNYLAGSLLDEAVYFGYWKTVSVALEAGVHPDDRRAFQRTLPAGGQVGGIRLIERRTSTSEQRLPGVRMVELALMHGADPDGDVEAFKQGLVNSHVRQYAIELRNASQRANSRFADTMACIRVLLEANPTCIEPEEPGFNSEWYGFLSLLGTATALQTQPSLGSPLAEEFRRLAALALEKGAALNYVVPVGDLPQALWLAKKDWATMAAILVELGAVESWQLPPGTDPESFFRGEGLAVYREATMRRRLRADVAGQPVSPGQAPAIARRGARL